VSVFKKKLLVTFIAFTLTLISAPVTNAAGITWSSRTTPLPIKEWNDIVYGNGQFVAVGNAGALMTSPNGVTWTSRTAAANNNWNSIAFAENTFVAVSETGTGNRVMTSTDGITWISRTSAANDNWASIAYGNGKFVAIGRSGSTMSSPDGITWTLGRSTDGVEWTAITYGNGIFVAVGTAALVMTSSDGISWTAGTRSSQSLLTIVFGNDRFIASATNSTLFSSLDGLTWSGPINPGVVAFFHGITYGNNLFVAVGRNPSWYAGEAGRAITSPDGITWTADTTTPANYANYDWRSVAYANGVYVAVGYEGYKRTTAGELAAVDPNPRPTYPGNDLVMTSGTFLLPPAFTISSASESKIVNTVIAGYTISSTGGTTASYAISPAAPAGTTFDTSTGLLSGTPTTVAAATAYTITATNTSGTSTQTFTLTVTAAPVIVDNGAAQAAAQAAAAKQQRELLEILSIIPSLGSLALNLGETTKALTLQKCVKKTQVKYVKKGAKCPKGFVRKR
jgi:hypothetical protein